VIWLLRHAEAEDGDPDSERPLTARGEEDARSVGLALAHMGLELDACVASPKVRAVDTARLVCEQLGLEVSEDERLAGGPFEAREVADGLGEQVLLVGHDPDFSVAIQKMTGAQVRMEKAGIAAVDRGELKALLRPSELRMLAAD
jgi:phosphohistidine phosphatase